MKILAIETSCDETAIAVIEVGRDKKTFVVRVFANLVSSQVKLHAEYGGVVPNLAKREHETNLPKLLASAVRSSKPFWTKKKATAEGYRKILERNPSLLHAFEKKILSLTILSVDAIAVTAGPGLAPALWTGFNFARALSILWQKPLIAINHMEGHFYSALIPPVSNIKYQVSRKNKTLNTKYLILNTIRFPVLALLVSGGHTELVLAKKRGSYKVIGETLDDAAGEAFDKVARLLHLGYPGGPIISRLAQRGDARKYPFPSPMIHSRDFNFSFSGLKTSVFYFLRSLPQKPSAEMKRDIAASFEKAVVDVLVKKTVRAAREFRVQTVILGGGVAANKKLRQELGEAIGTDVPGSVLLEPELWMTGDNALMIALAAFGKFKNGKPVPKAPPEVKPNARIDQLF